MLWSFVHLRKPKMFLLQVKDAARACGNYSFEKPLSPNPFLFSPMIRYCLAFTYHAEWLSLSVALTTERGNLQPLRTGLCNRFTSLSHGWRAVGGNSGGVWDGSMDHRAVKRSICVPSQHISSVPQPRYRSAHTKTTIWKGLSSLSKHCKVNTSTVWGRILTGCSQCEGLKEWLKQSGGGGTGRENIFVLLFSYITGQNPQYTLPAFSVFLKSFHCRPFYYSSCCDHTLEFQIKSTWTTGKIVAINHRKDTLYYHHVCQEVTRVRVYGWKSI